MSRCIVKFGASTRPFRCSEIDAIRLGATIGSKDVILIDSDGTINNITFTLEDIKRCSDMVREFNEDSAEGTAYFEDTANPLTIDDCIEKAEGYTELNSGMLRLAILIHSTSAYASWIDAELRKSIIDYLDFNLITSL